MTNVCILLTMPPTPDPEAAELALALATFEHDVQVICLGAGIAWLLKDQGARKSGGKSPDKLLKAFPMYDIERIGYRSTDLTQIASDTEQLLAIAEPMDDDAIRQAIANAKHCLSF
jgi:sulfur relay (sulfurtransferase) DsrF/TusC family protein